MDEQEFQRILDLFPIVRFRDHTADRETPRQHLTSHSARDEVEFMELENALSEEHKKGPAVQGTDREDQFWEKLKLTAEGRFSKN